METIVNSWLLLNYRLLSAIVVATIDLNNSSSIYVCFPLFDKNLSNFERKDYLLMSPKLREATGRVQSVVK